MRINFSTADNVAFATLPSWSHILMGLKEESNLLLFDDTFEEWVLKEWGIRLLHENEMFPSHLTGIEIDDEVLTMLMLKFPKASFSRA